MNIAQQIILSPEEETTINRWATGRSFPLRIVQRAQIIRLAAKGVFSHNIALQLGLSRPTIQLWRDRFCALRLDGLEKDAPRPGRLPRISQQKVTSIVNATLQQTPQDATHWSTRSMAKAHGVSNATVSRIWKEYNLKPHLVETFKLSRDKRFVEKLHDVVGLYLNPPDKALVFCVDEKSQIQALDRTRPLQPLRPGIPARQTHDYTRHGTTTLFAALSHARWQSHRRLHATTQTSRIHSFLTGYQCQNTARTGFAFNCRQLRHTQTCSRSNVAKTSSAFSFALYSDFQLMGQHGRTLVPGNYRQAYSPRFIQKCPGFNQSYYAIH